MLQEPIWPHTQKKKKKTVKRRDICKTYNLGCNYRVLMGYWLTEAE